MAPSRAAAQLVALPFAPPALTRPLRSGYAALRRPASSSPVSANPSLVCSHLRPRRGTGSILLFPPPCTRPYSQLAGATPHPPDYLNDAELHIFNKIKAELDPAKLEVQDISGGCGSMYAIEVESPKFKGLSPIKQHKMVNEILKEEIAQWHGVQLRTRAA